LEVMEILLPRTLAAAALRQRQEPIRYALCQRKGPSLLSEAIDMNSISITSQILKKNQAS